MPLKAGAMSPARAMRQLLPFSAGDGAAGNADRRAAAGVLPVHRTLRYTGSLYAKPVSGVKEVEVTLRKRNSPDQVLARASLRITSSTWTRYEFALELPKGSVPASNRRTS